MAFATMTRAIAAASSCSSSTVSLSKRFFFTGSSSSSPFVGLTRLRSPPAALSHLAVRVSAPGAGWIIPIRCMVRRSGGDSYSPLNSRSSGGSGFSDRPPTEMAPLFPGCDYEHWLIVMDKPGGEGATKHQMIDCYVQTLAKVLGSEEEAKKKIYNVSCERYFGFGCEIDEETSNKLEGLPGVLFVLPDSYVDVENKDYGGYFLNPQFRYATTCHTITDEVRIGLKQVIKTLLTDPIDQIDAITEIDLFNDGFGSFGDPLARRAITRCQPTELYVNGEIVQRSPERQRRVEPVPQRAQDRPRYNDRTRYVRRRENQR